MRNALEDFPIVAALHVIPANSERFLDFARNDRKVFAHRATSAHLPNE